jgi:hypothetical protein
MTPTLRLPAPGRGCGVFCRPRRKGPAGLQQQERHGRRARSEGRNPQDLLMAMAIAQRPSWLELGSALPSQVCKHCQCGSLAEVRVHGTSGGRTDMQNLHGEARQVQVHSTQSLGSMWFLLSPSPPCLQTNLNCLLICNSRRSRAMIALSCHAPAHMPNDDGTVSATSTWKSLNYDQPLLLLFEDPKRSRTPRTVHGLDALQESLGQALPDRWLPSPVCRLLSSPSLPASQLPGSVTSLPSSHPPSKPGFQRSSPWHLLALPASRLHSTSRRST